MKLLPSPKRSRRARRRAAALDEPTSLVAFSHLDPAQQAVMAQALLGAHVEHRWLQRAS